MWIIYLIWPPPQDNLYTRPYGKNVLQISHESTKLFDFFYSVIRFINNSFCSLYFISEMIYFSVNDRIEVLERLDSEKTMMDSLDTPELGASKPKRCK